MRESRPVSHNCPNRTAQRATRASAYSEKLQQRPPAATAVAAAATAALALTTSIQRTAYCHKNVAAAAAAAGLPAACQVATRAASLQLTNDLSA